MSGSDGVRGASGGRGTVGAPRSSKENKDLRVAALKYNPDMDRAPQVVASGSGFVAQKILEIAIENGIAIYHDDSAATMLAKLGSGREIPPELYQIVVNIYLSLLEAAESRVRPSLIQDSEESIASIYEELAAKPAGESSFGDEPETAPAGTLEE